jgi:hypothetical protein
MDMAERVRALEEEVAALRAEREAARAPLTRRRLLGGAALAAGALASPRLAGSAAADTGGNVVLGNANDADAPTIISKENSQNAVAGATLALRNAIDGAPLNLGVDLVNVSEISAGDLFSVGFLVYAWDDDALAFVYDDSWATQLFPSIPFRILDTRQAGATSTNWGRSRVTNPSGKFDSAGRLRGGQSINLRLDDLTELARALIGNFTVTGSSAGGFLTAWPSGESRPNASLVNWSPGQSIANFATVAVGGDSSDRDSISIYVSQTTHVIVDFSGAHVGGFLNLVGPFAQQNAVTASSTAGRFGRRPRRHAARR